MDRSELAERIVASAGDAVVFVDTEGLVRLWNAGAEDVFGYVAADAVGEPIDLIIPERFRKPHWEGFEAAMDAGETSYDRGERLSVPAIGADGERLSIEFTVSLIEDGGETMGVAAIVRDVTDEWERRQRRTERIEKLEARLEELEGGSMNGSGGESSRNGSEEAPKG